MALSSRLIAPCRPSGKEEDPLGLYCVGAYDDPFDELVGVPFHQDPVFESTGFHLV